MKIRFAMLAMGLVLSGCATTPPPHSETRQLSATEKEALRRSLSQTLKDPDSAQFKWMPAVVAKKDAPLDSPIGYCGLVNGKNSYGGYVGFKRFYATITRNAKGEYDRGLIQHIEGRPNTFGGTSTVSDAIETGAMEGSCEAWGYVDFSAAN